MSSKKEELQLLISKYTSFKAEGRLDLSSEETMRTWINELLSIFDWDVMDTSQVLQEKILSKEEKEKLKAIDSTSTRPDYTFRLGKEKLTFLDAKALSVNIKNSDKSAFQIKSYGWSISASFAFLTNFEEFAIYDCSYTPSINQKAIDGRIYLKIEDYLDNFELLEKHLLKENMIHQSFNKSNQSDITIDTVFAEQLSSFRLSLANEIVAKNGTLILDNLELLSYLTQVIINRVMFIKICEARRVEKDELLLNFKNLGFWTQFKDSSYNDFYEHYDGPLFDRVDVLQKIELDDTIFDELLDLLYYPSPYRFDVIPTKLLSDIYEIFLSKKLTIKDGSVSEVLKPEYLKSNGAVITPQYLVQDLIERTLDFERKNIADIFEKKTLDFACGSGIFLIELFDYIQDKLIENYKNNQDIRFKQFFFQKGDEVTLTVEGKRELIARCIYGIDIDPEAVEVARMSLSLKVIDDINFIENYQELGLFGQQILNSVGDNISCGNTLVKNDIIEKYPKILEDEEQLLKTNPYAFEDEFDFIVGNPPYVEVKHYNEVYPFMHKYIKEQYKTTSNGKIDLSVAFIERGISLLSSSGKMGLIVQKRFFKTQYGKSIRNYISTNQLLSKVVDFDSTALFKNRITYISSIVLDKSRPNEVIFSKVKEDENLWELDKLDFETISSSAFTENPWNFEEPKLLSIQSKLLKKFGNFGAFGKIKVGIQVLWDKAYHIEAKSFNGDGTLTGDTKLEKNITIEIDACRPLMVNKKFYPFCSDATEIFVIFPYTIEENVNTPLGFNEFTELYPLASQYLMKYKELIVENVKIETKFGNNGWHLFTRVQNHTATYPKILLPMTALDTFATVTKNSLNYCDNANMFFIDIPIKSNENLYTIAGVLNSTIFSVLARSIAMAQQNGYFKFNKQFIEPIPFPTENFENNPTLVKEIFEIIKNINQKQEQYINSTPRQKNIFKEVLINLWKNLDGKVFELYELSENEIEFFIQKGRNIDRVEILDA